MSNHNVCYTRDDAELVESPVGVTSTLQQIQEYLDSDPRHAVIFTDAKVILARCADDRSYYTANYPTYEPDDVICEGVEDLEEIVDLTLSGV